MVAWRFSNRLRARSFVEACSIGMTVFSVAVGLPLEADADAPPSPERPPAPVPPVTSPEGDVLKSMTLGEAIQFAEAHQPSLRLGRARIASARALVEVPRAQWQPKIGMTAELLGGTSNNTTSSYVSSAQVDIARIGGSSAIVADKVDASSLRPYASSYLGIGLDQEIFDFGRIATQTAALDAMVDVARFHAESDRLDIDLAVKESFFAVLGARAVVTASESAFDRAKAQRDLTSAGVDNGLRTPVDLARADAELAKYDVGRVRARGSLELAQGLLAAVIAFPSRSVDARDAQGDFNGGAPSLDKAIADAHTRDPLLREAQSKVKAQEAETTAIDAERRPNLYLTSSLSGRAGGAPLASGASSFGRGFLPDVPNWDAGLVLSVPIFDGVVKARRNAARSQESVARSELALTEQNGTEEVERAYFSLRTATATIPALERARDSARTAFDQTSAAFKAGLGTTVDVADSETLLTQAEIQLALGRFELARARALLARATAEPEDARSR